MAFCLIPLLPITALVLFGYTTIRFTAGRRKGKAHIACVGDSLTYGCALPLFFCCRYPAVLQRRLGPEAQTAVFAVNDRTLQNTGNKPFRRERAFRQSKAFGPETVVILLGTNDAKEKNWISAEAFRQEYAALIAEYRALGTVSRVILCTPPCGFKPAPAFFFVSDEAMRRRLPAVAEEVRAVAEAEGAELVDLYAETAGHRELFSPDGLHPNAAGARMIAEAIDRQLKRKPDGHRENGKDE